MAIALCIVLALGGLWIIGLLSALVRYAWFYYWCGRGWRPEFYKEHVVKEVQTQFAAAIMNAATDGEWREMDGREVEERIERVKDEIHAAIVNYIKGYLDLWLPPIPRRN